MQILLTKNNHLDALENELSRANVYYDQIIEDVKRKIEEESGNVKELERELNNKKEEREKLRAKTESLRAEFNNQSFDYDSYNEKDIDEQIKMKLRQLEEAEGKRKDAQEELDRIYQEWNTKLIQHVNNAYANSVNARDQEQLQEINRLIEENDKVSRSVNKLLETFDFDIQGMTDSLQGLRDEDSLILDELKRAEDAIQAKQHTLNYLDERVLALTQQLEALKEESEERKEHIEQLKEQIEAARKELEEAGGENNGNRDLERELAAKQAEIRALEQQVKEKEAQYDEWREKVNIKQKVILRKSKSRKREYVPDETDEADVIVSQYINEHQDPVPIHKVGYRSYIYGTINIQVKDDLEFGPVVVLSKGKVMKLYEFLECHSLEEKQKLEDLNNNDQVVINSNGY